MSNPAPLVYRVDRSLLGPTLREAVCELGPDEASAAWLREIGSRPHGYWTTKLIARWSKTTAPYDVHGRLAAYPMHMLSERAYRSLLGDGPFESLLDVGAGAGYVTSHARPLFHEILCTETAPALADRLEQAGFAVARLDLTETDLGRTFAVVSALNVLDRTLRPRTLLSRLAAHVRPGGRLLLSVPLPVSMPREGDGGGRPRQEFLPSEARGFEEAAEELTGFFLRETGMTLARFSRVPYLSRGDFHCPRYVLDAGVWVFDSVARG